jgi:hypothetical protein
MFHFIYKTTSSSGKYYIGRHSTLNLNDNYFGSGKWVRSIKDKSQLTLEIIQFCETLDELKVCEELLLLEHVGKIDCMNFNLSSCGFSTGELNPSASEEGRKRISERVSGENNPAKRPEVAKKIAEANQRPRGKWEKPMSEEGRKNISKSRTGISYSEEGKKKLVRNRKKTYEEKGIKPYVPSFSGQTHSQETIDKMKKKALELQCITCKHCGTIAKPGPFARWHGDKCKMIKYEDSLE